MAGTTVQPVSLHHATRERYLSYALSVITSRALPDVRDGLKPVQRRILYAMFNDMGLRPGGRYRKCAAVVGEVMGKYHPHGDQSIYDALVRMAQPFSLRAPLVDGQGNFGSLDGDPPAAMRYTECKLQQLAEELLSELRKRTVDFRPNYDGQLTEPVVLPAQFPQLLVNGCEGIAVGMATRVPPHNLAEVIKACVALIDDRSLTVKQILRRYIKGPDFPTGGRILNDHANVVEFYENGQGSFRLRALWDVEKEGRKKQIIISSVPYGQNKARLIEKLGQQVRERKLPQVVDVRDESTEDVRIVLELKQGANADAVMAYVFKHTPLECTWPMNLTALVPTPGSDVPTPARLDLKSVLEHWLDFRFETVRRRFEYDLKKLLERIHILEGFEIIFDALDEAIALIRSSEGRRHAAEELIDRFDLSDIQADAILELKLYRLAKLEILQIREELEEKRAEAARIEQILASDGELWAVVRAELIELKKLYGDKRRTEMEGGKELVYDEEAFIIKEDTFIIVTRDGWIKRQSSFSDISKIRVREDDEIGWLIKAHTRSSITFFSTLGSAYVMRVDSVPSTTGYGEPLQRFFAFADGERVCGVISHDARHRVRVQETLIQAPGDVPPPPYGIALTRRGRVLRFPLRNHEEPSTKSGRRYARVGPDGDAVLAVYPTTGTEKVCVASRLGRAMLFPVSEVAILKSSGRGTLGIKLRDDDEAMAFELAEGTLDGPEVVTGQGRSLVVRERKFGVGKRGGRGKVVLKRGEISTWVRGPSIHLGKGERLPSNEKPPESTSSKAETDDDQDIGVTVIGTTIGEA